MIRIACCLGVVACAWLTAACESRQDLVRQFFGYIAGQLAMAGFVAASIEYRTADEATFPAAVHDVKAAVRWMRAHAGTYGIAPDQIGAIGGSAGAHLIAMLATSGGVKELEGSGGHDHTSSDIQAAVAMGGAYDLQPNDEAGPRFVEAVTGFVGTVLEERYRRAGALVSLIPIEAPDLHGFWGAPFHFPEAKRRFVGFFRRVLRAAR